MPARISSKSTPKAPPKLSAQPTRPIFKTRRSTCRQVRLSDQNVDCTIICEQPKIGPLSERMRASISRIMGLEKNRISIKATTSEKLGFTGRKEGIASLATAMVSKVE